MHLLQLSQQILLELEVDLVQSSNYETQYGRSQVPRTPSSLMGDLVYPRPVARTVVLFLQAVGGLVVVARKASGAFAVSVGLVVVNSGDVGGPRLQPCDQRWLGRLGVVPCGFQLLASR